LKKAEDHTDLTTDVDKEKKNRKNRKRKKNSSTSSDEELNPSTQINIKPLPKSPTALNVNLHKPSTVADWPGGLGGNIPLGRSKL